MVIEKPCLWLFEWKRLGWNRLGLYVSKTCLRVEGRRGGGVV